jgi:hypothetical protein
VIARIDKGLLRQPHFPHQLSKPWIRTQRIKQEVGLQTLQKPIALLISSLEPPEGVIFVSHIGREESDIGGRWIASCALRLSRTDIRHVPAGSYFIAWPRSIKLILKNGAKRLDWMELNSHLARYILRFYGSFLTHDERQIQNHFFVALKANEAYRDAEVKASKEAQEELKKTGKSIIHYKVVCDDPDVLRIFVDYEAFQLKTAARIVRENGADVCINVCPLCGKLARTPQARQCRFCCFDWHTA